MLATSPEVSARRARELLQRRIAVQLQGIEVVPARVLVVMPMKHLCFGFDLQTAQLVFQPDDRAGQFRQVEVDGVDLLVEASTENADLAGIVEHGVQQVGIDARHFHALGRYRLAAGEHWRGADLEIGNGVLAGWGQHGGERHHLWRRGFQGCPGRRYARRG